MSHDWSNGLFAFSKNMNKCLISCFLPCGMIYYHSKATEMATSNNQHDENNKTSCMAACALELFCCGCVNRNKIREAFNIQGSFIQDMALYCCCTFCMEMQDINEVDDRCKTQTPQQQYHYGQYVQFHKS